MHLTIVSIANAEQITKYNNAVVLVSDTINLDRKTITIPVKSEAPYGNLVIHINSCFRLVDSAHELVSNLSIRSNLPNKEKIYKNFLLYNQKPYLNTEMENSYYEIRLLDCHNIDRIILNQTTQ